LHFVAYLLAFRIDCVEIRAGGRTVDGRYGAEEGDEEKNPQKFWWVKRLCWHVIPPVVQVIGKVPKKCISRLLSRNIREGRVEQYIHNKLMFTYRSCQLFLLPRKQEARNRRQNGGRGKICWVEKRGVAGAARKKKKDQV